MSIIKSLLDEDQYKLSMQQAVLCKFPDAQVEYEFKCRNKEPVDLLQYKDEIQDEIDELGFLKFRQDELDYLSGLRYMKSSYVNFLRYFRLNPENVVLYEKDGKLGINISGNWLDTILFEVPILAIVSEIYCKYTAADSQAYAIGASRLEDKISLLKLKNDEVSPFIKFTDFGTRRRFSNYWQNYVVSRCAKELPKNFMGTSNVYLARKYGVKPIGTMAHEWIMAGQGMEEQTSVKYSQRYMLQKWADVYRGDLGTALSDTLGFNAFLNDFDMYFSKLFDGCRHDSGDPHTWCHKLVQHYQNYKIDPLTKTAVFSDGLDFQKMIQIHDAFSKRINVSFGIGTNLTNDCGVKPLQIVIKMTKCNGRPVAKISDSPGKQMCEDKEYLKYLASRLNIPEERV